MTNEKEEFYNWLVQVREICEKPLLTQEEVELMSRMEQWEATSKRGPSGEVLYAKRDPGKTAPTKPSPAKPVVGDEEDDDEIIDVSPSGARIPSVGGGAK